MEEETNLSPREANRLISSAARDTLFDALRVGALAREKIRLDVYRAIDEEGLDQGALIESLGASKQYISKLLKAISRGDFNFTIGKLADLSCALNRHLTIRILSDDEAAPIVPYGRLEAVQRAAYGPQGTGEEHEVITQGIQNETDTLLASSGKVLDYTDWHSRGLSSQRKIVGPGEEKNGTS